MFSETLNSFFKPILVRLYSRSDLLGNFRQKIQYSTGATYEYTERDTAMGKYAQIGYPRPLLLAWIDFNPNH